MRRNNEKSIVDSASMASKKIIGHQMEDSNELTKLRFDRVAQNKEKLIYYRTQQE